MSQQVLYEQIKLVWILHQFSLFVTCVVQKHFQKWNHRRRRHPPFHIILVRFARLDRCHGEIHHKANQWSHVCRVSKGNRSLNYMLAFSKSLPMGSSVVSLWYSNLCRSFVLARRTFIDEMCLIAYASRRLRNANLHVHVHQHRQLRVCRVVQIQTQVLWYRNARSPRRWVRQLQKTLQLTLKTRSHLQLVARVRDRRNRLAIVFKVVVPSASMLE